LRKISETRIGEKDVSPNESQIGFPIFILQNYGGFWRKTKISIRGYLVNLLFENTNAEILPASARSFDRSSIEINRKFLGLFSRA